MSEHLEDVTRRIQYLMLKDTEAGHEDIHDFAQRCHIKEIVDRCEQDPSKRHMVDVSADGSLGFLKGDFTQFFQNDAQKANKRDEAHELCILLLLLLGCRV